MVLFRVLYTIIECSIKQEENSMSKLLKYLKKYKIESILAPFFKLIEVAFELIVPLIVSTIIDVGIENGDKVYIIKRCLLLGLFGILGLCSTLVAQYFSAKASVGFASDIRHALFQHIGKLYRRPERIIVRPLFPALQSELRAVVNRWNSRQQIQQRMHRKNMVLVIQL